MALDEDGLDGGLDDPARDRERFLGEMVTSLAETIEGSLGIGQAEGFIAAVASRIARAIDREYRRREGLEALDPARVAAALVDLKRRIDGGFAVSAVTADRIELVNVRCPFGPGVVGRESLCGMTTGVFGRIAADNLGFARVDLREAIARGDRGCRVVIWLTEGPGREGVAFHGPVRGGGR